MRSDWERASSSLGRKESALPLCLGNVRKVDRVVLNALPVAASRVGFRAQKKVLAPDGERHRLEDKYDPP